MEINQKGKLELSDWEHNMGRGMLEPEIEVSADSVDELNARIQKVCAQTTLDLVNDDLSGEQRDELPHQMAAVGLMLAIVKKLSNNVEIEVPSSEDFKQ